MAPSSLFYEQSAHNTDPSIPRLIEGAELVKSVRVLLRNEDWVRLAEQARRWRSGEIESAVPDMCFEEMEDMAVAALTLESLEELRRCSKTSDVQAVREALKMCRELRSQDERTLKFVEWGVSFLCFFVFFLIILPFAELFLETNFIF
jgi:hypothetical protein